METKIFFFKRAHRWIGEFSNNVKNVARLSTVTYLAILNFKVEFVAKVLSLL